MEEGVKFLDIIKNPFLLIIRGIIRKFLGLEFTNAGYIRKKNGKRFCSVCFDDKIKLIHLTKLNDTWWKCNACDKSFHKEKDEPPFVIVV